MSEELKPCPFCGCNQIIEGTETDNSCAIPMTIWFVKCSACGTSKSSISNPYRAEKRWNTRPAENALNAEITRYRRALYNLKDDCKRRLLFAESDLEKLFLYETITHVEAELDYGKDSDVPANAPDTNVGNNEVKDE